MAGKYYFSDEDLGILRRLIEWSRNLKITGPGVLFQNSQEGAHCDISPPRGSPTAAPSGKGVFIAKLVLNDGSAGSNSAVCSYTYDVYNLGTTTPKLASMLSPQGSPCRVTMVECFHAATLGICYYDASNANALTIAFAIDETGETTACS